MPNNKLMGELEFREHIKVIKTRELLEVMAVQTYQACNVQEDHAKRIKKLEGQNKKWMALGTGTGTGIAAAVALILQFLKGGN